MWKMNKRPLMYSQMDPRKGECSETHQTSKPAFWEWSNYMPSGHQGPIMSLTIRGDGKWNEPELFHKIQDKHYFAGLELQLIMYTCLFLTFALNGF